MACTSNGTYYKFPQVDHRINLIVIADSVSLNYIYFKQCNCLDIHQKQQTARKRNKKIWDATYSFGLFIHKATVRAK